MTKGILGKKLGMTQVFGPNGSAIAVTVIEVGSVVLQKKDIENDGYEAIQLGYDDIKDHRANKPEKGHAAKANTAPKRFIREIDGVNLGEYEVGQELKADLFAAGDIVDVSGVTKGKGFQGAIKRHNQSRGPMAHGSRYHRGPGSLGSINPGRVFKGQTLPGQMGGDNVTIQNLEVVKVVEDRNLILVKGSIPGPKNSYVVVRSAVKNK